jgi:aarF domain-containing kinase
MVCLQIMVDEAVAAIDAMSREAMGEALRIIVGGTSALAAARGAEALGPLRSLLMPLPLPTALLSSLQPAVSVAVPFQVCVCHSGL